MTNLTAIGLDKYKIDYVEVHPEVDEKITRANSPNCTCWKKGKCLTLINVLTNWKNPQCPRHMTRMKFSSIRRPDGCTWEYYRCPSFRWWTRCYVTSGAHEVHEYLKRVRQQSQPFYQKTDPARFRCQCDRSLVRATSLSVKNP